MQFVGIAIENFDSNQDRSQAPIGAPRRRNGPTFFVCRQASSLLLTMTASGPKTDLAAPKSNFRFTAESGLRANIARCPKSANKRLMHRSKRQLYSITSSAR